MTTKTQISKSPIPIQIKICGITNLEQAIAISQLGATALGFICVQASPRYIEPKKIRAIATSSQIPSHTQKIGVFANASHTEITNVVEIGGLTGVQLHGDESPEFCQQLASIFSETKTAANQKIPLIKALRIRSAADLEIVNNYSNYVDLFLLDAYHPHQLGGTGQTLDWDLLLNFQPNRPWWLAGGINPDNILDAIRISQADGIDLSSGVETSPGNKDLEKVGKLFDQLHTAGFGGK